MVNFGYPYNDIVICKDSTDYLAKWKVVPARNSGWKKKSTYMNHNLPGGV